MLRAAFLILLLIGAPTAPGGVPGENTAVRATATDYIEGYYLSDPVRMKRSLHTRYLKHTISDAHGQLNIIEKRGTDMVREVRNKKEVTPVSQRKKEITILVVDGDVACVKLVATAWTNYITLLKQNGEWKILSVVKRNHF
jgi:hypothetical protein